jgi:hypothetical protein
MKDVLKTNIKPKKSNKTFILCSVVSLAIGFYCILGSYSAKEFFNTWSHYRSLQWGNYLRLLQLSSVALGVFWSQYKFGSLFSKTWYIFPMILLIPYIWFFSEIDYKDSDSTSVLIVSLFIILALAVLGASSGMAKLKLRVQIVSEIDEELERESKSMRSQNE